MHIKILVGIAEGKSIVDRPKLRWENNTKIDLKEIEREVVDYIYLAQDRVQRQALVNSVMPWI
jgi:hypothetical protein